MYVYENTRNESEIANLNSLIGPITLRFNISDNAKTLAKKRGIKLDSYDINFDGAKCANGSTKVTGVNPQTAQEIICTFDTLKNYKPAGTYTVTNYNGKEEQITIPLDPIQIQ